MDYSIVDTCEKLVKPGFLVQLARTGSHAYGLATPESDEDFRGIFIPSKEDLLGMHHTRNIERKSPDPDIVLKCLEEFLRLALEGNPNILEQLFIDDENLLYSHNIFSPFRAHRNMFLSKKVKRTYTGYAIGQLKKMRSGHTRDLGAKRKALIEKYSYDTKNCSHVFRLLIQGKEILEKGALSVKLLPGDAEYVKAIRRGEIFKTIDEAQVKADELIKNLDDMQSPLPELPDAKFIEDLMIRTQAEYISKDGIRTMEDK